MKLSVCMIVKNEEKIVGRCLECVKKFADEIIIVDTGSSDKTKEIALKYTSKIYDFEWSNDFAKARNYCFSLATCDYIMWLDADDIINDLNINKINQLKQNLTNEDTIMCKYILGFDCDNNPTFSYFRERIFKASSKPLWLGFIHECVVPSGKIIYTDIEIVHSKLEKNNPKRNLNIYRKHKKNGVEFNSREQYYFSKELFYNGYYKTCIKNLKRYLKMDNKFYPNYVDGILHLAKCYRLTNQLDKALNVLFDFIKQNSPNSEIVCEIAEIYFKKGRIENAIYFYESALNITPNYSSGAFIDNNYYYYIPLLQLTFLCYKQNDFKKAKKYHLLAKQSYPNDEKVIYNDKFF